MNSVPRKLTVGLVLALGAAACGDKVTVAGPPPAATPIVHSVIVSPSSATIGKSSSFTFGAQVEADAPLATTVTWSVAGGTGITVDQNGVASSSATASGTASICAASTVTPTIKGCAQLAVTGDVAPPVVGVSTVQIDAITVGCTSLNAALALATGSPAACGLQVPVATNNVGGQMDVAIIVTRPPNSGVTGVVLEVLGGPPTFATVEATYTQTLTGDFIARSDSGLALQTTSTNRIVFSVQTAAYTLSATGAATVKHINGQKKIRVRLVGGSATGLVETQVSFRNANGFHITAPDPTGTNINGLPIRQTSAAGFAWRGGTPLTITAATVNYTGVSLPTAAGSFVVNIGGCPSANALANGPPVRAASATLTSGVWTGTLPYTNNSANASGSNLDGYEMDPVCQTFGEVPGANGIDATGNAFITLPLGGVFGAFNTLNNPIGPVDPTLAVTQNFRLDDAGPNPVIGYAPNPNGRMNGWMNGSVLFNKLNLAAVLASGNPTATGGSDINGIVLPTGVGNNLPVDLGFGGVTSFRARGGGTVGGLPCNAPVGQVPAVQVADCATFAQRTTVIDSPALPETPNYYTDGLIIQTIDAFGNGTNPPGGAIDPGFNIANLLDPAHPLAANGVLFLGVDVTNPTLVALGGNGTTALTGSIAWLADVGGLLVGANSCTTAPVAPWVITPLPTGVFASKCWDITAQDQATALPAIASGIATIPYTGIAGAQGELWVSEQRRDANTSLFWCPVVGFADIAGGPASTPAGAYQSATTACPSWLGGTTTFNMAAGAINPAWTAGSIVDAYYGVALYTKDQAGNVSTNLARQFIQDGTAPTAAPPTIQPAIMPATGTVTFSAGVFDNLDVGRGVFGLQFPLLATLDASAPQYIRLPWANKATGATNPTGWLFDGPSAVSLTLTSTTPVFRSLEAVVAGGAFPTFVVGTATGNIQFPGIITPGTTQAGAQLTNVVFGAQSVARNPTPAAGYMSVPTATALTLPQLGMPGGTAYFANQDATIPPFAGMGWAVIVPTSAGSIGNIDISGNANNSNSNSKSLSAVAVGHAAAQVLPNPFPGGVKFYWVDTRQNPQVFTAGAATGTALVEICTAGTPLNDQVANSWTFTCTMAPGTQGAGRLFDFAGFSDANNSSLYGTSFTNVASNGHLYGLPWSNPASVNFSNTGTVTIPILAIGFSAAGNGLATFAINANTTYVK